MEFNIVDLLSFCENKFDTVIIKSEVDIFNVKRSVEICYIDVYKEDNFTKCVKMKSDEKDLTQYTINAILKSKVKSFKFCTDETLIVTI